MFRLRAIGAELAGVFFSQGTATVRDIRNTLGGYLPLACTALSSLAWSGTHRYIRYGHPVLRQSLTCYADIKLDNIQLTPPEDGTELLKSLVAAEAKDPSIYKTTPDGSRIYKSREMQQDELTFPILCDMDSAEFGKATHSRLAQALPYRAPEVLLGAAWDCKIDIWNLGVLVSQTPVWIGPKLTWKTRSVSFY
jgi:serine/threonine protein kinase